MREIGKRVTEQDKDAIEYLYARCGKTASEIVKILNVGRGTVYNVLKERNVPLHNPARSEALKKRNEIHVQEELAIDEVTEAPEKSDDMNICRILRNQEIMIELLQKMVEEWR